MSAGEVMTLEEATALAKKARLCFADRMSKIHDR